MAEIKSGDGFENDFEWVSLVFSGSACEAMQALTALKHLVGLQSVATFALFNGVLASALWAHGILL